MNKRANETTIRWINVLLTGRSCLSQRKKEEKKKRKNRERNSKFFLMWVEELVQALSKHAGGYVSRKNV